MDLVEALRTTGSARDFTEQPVHDDVVAAILDDARFAPSGGNRQPWRVAVVKDLAIRRHLAGLMYTVWHEYLGESTDVSQAPFAFGRSTGAKPVVEPNPLLDNIEQVPVVLAVAADLNKIALMDANTDRFHDGRCLIYPFCWNVLLATRSQLGGVNHVPMRAETAVAPDPGCHSQRLLPPSSHIRCVHAN